MRHGPLKRWYPTTRYHKPEDLDMNQKLSYSGIIWVQKFVVTGLHMSTTSTVLFQLMYLFF